VCGEQEEEGAEEEEEEEEPEEVEEEEMPEEEEEEEEDEEEDDDDESDDDDDFVPPPDHPRRAQLIKKWTKKMRKVQSVRSGRRHRARCCGASCVSVCRIGTGLGSVGLASCLARRRPRESHPSSPSPGRDARRAPRARA